jgi:hypothetical protein
VTETNIWAFSVYPAFHVRLTSPLHSIRKDADSLDDLNHGLLEHAYILYGGSGTGKSYNTKYIITAIADMMRSHPAQHRIVLSAYEYGNVPDRALDLLDAHPVTSAPVSKKLCGTEVRDLVKQDITSKKELDKAWKRLTNTKSTAKTLNNAESSRKHGRYSLVSTAYLLLIDPRSPPPLPS